MKKFLAMCGLALAATGMAMPNARAQQVYVGTSNGRGAMMAHPEQWEYVRKNADGFYVNFIQMLKMDKDKCAQMASLFTHKNAFYESDSRYKGLGGFPDGGQFRRDLQTKELSALLDGGFAVPYASLNYGVDKDKKADLQTIGVARSKKRPVLAQFGPWNVGGNLFSDTGRDNKAVRDLIEQNAGCVTDGPMGFWQADAKGMRGGSISSVKFAHDKKKLSTVMVCPYGAGVKSYDFGQWLSQMQACVRAHEDAGAKPDIWSVFEYATTVPALPESVNGKPANTTMGAAYWLLHHLRDPKNYAQLTPEAVVPPNANKGSQVDLDMTVQNTSDWLDLCPVLSVRLSKSDAKNWTVRFVIDGKPLAKLGDEGGTLAFVGDLRLWPGTARRVHIVCSPRTGTAQNTAPPKTVTVTLSTHPSSVDVIKQRIVLHAGSPEESNPVAFAPRW